ncbi:uncharacterized protein LOC134837371 [Culicoides brevitarsis]|uniref:uncharacterized protein LOC134837371 n=1 Tax=Culicoides brevitarsis TaxID=469753 RepID=UPI00307C55E1
MAEITEILTDDEVLEIISVCKDVPETSNVTVLEWGTSTLSEEVTGFLGEHLKLTIKAKIDNDQIVNESFFIKTLPFRAKDRRFVEEIGVLRKEVHLYVNVLNEMPKYDEKSHWSPECYYARDDLLVLEDLSVKDFHLLPPEIEFTDDHMKVALKSLAMMHASSINFEKNVVKKPLNDIYDGMLYEVTVARRNNWFRTGLKAIEQVALQRTRYKYMAETIKKKFYDAMNVVFDMVDNELIPPDFLCVISHRDLWRNNLMYKFARSEDDEETLNYNAPLEAVLIDFQIARYLPPAVDILMLLYLLQRNNDRKSRYDAHISHYYECMKDALAHFGLDIESIFPFEELWRTCEHFQLLGAVLKGVFLPMTHLPKGVIDDIHKNADAYRKFIAVDRTETILHYIDTDEYFRNWMIEAVEELIEITLIH